MQAEEWTSGSWRFTWRQGSGPDLVLAFSSVGQDPRQWPAPEFTVSASAGGDRSLLCIADLSRSWGQDPAFPDLLRDRVRSLSPQGRILALGLSMGGCLALQAASLLPVTHCLAIGPQWALGPDVPQEVRWQPWSARLQPGAGARAHWPLPAGTAVTLMHGLADDLHQAQGFPLQPGVDHLLFPGISHSALGPELKRHGLLPGILEAVLAGDRRRLFRLVSRAGGQSRKKLPLPPLPASP